MTQPRKYKQIHPSKFSPAQQAAADYHAENGIYNNRHARQSREWEEYYAAYHDLVASEPIEEQTA
tara:strand:- start:21281 stop:21475 length:195 start_codon:yes stop_codon:yes gene_type:complete